MMAPSLSVIIFSSAWSCCLRHSTLRVRPVLKVSRSLRTVPGMSGVACRRGCGCDGFCGHGWVSFLTRGTPDPNQPVGPPRRGQLVPLLRPLGAVSPPCCGDERRERVAVGLFGGATPTGRAGASRRRGDGRRLPAVFAEPVARRRPGRGRCTSAPATSSESSTPNLRGDALELSRISLAALVGPHTDRLRRDPAAGRAERGDVFEETGPALRRADTSADLRPAMRSARRRRNRLSSSAVGQSKRRSIGDCRGASPIGSGAVFGQRGGLVLEHLGLVDLVDGGAAGHCSR